MVGWAGMGMGVGGVGWVGGHWTLLYKSVPNGMPGLLLFHVHHTSCNFQSDWLLHVLPTFTFSLVSTVALHLDNSISNAMPGLLVVHVHHTFEAKAE